MQTSRYEVYQNKDTKVDLTNVKLVKDKIGYCLDVTYRIETLNSIEECRIPCMHLPISLHRFGIKLEEDWGLGDTHTANIGFGEMTLMPDKDGNEYYVKTIKEKTKEMTLEEIEKKLGHKVKIVNK